MEALRFQRRCLWTLTVALAITATLARAQPDNPGADLNVEPDEQVQVVYAAYGGATADKTASHYVNVTTKVSDLLQKTPEGFAVTEDTITGTHGSDLCQSLLIVYNFEQESFFYNIAADAGTVSANKLRFWAKGHRDAARIGHSIDTTAASDNFHIVFAGYGLGDMFLNATEPVKKLLNDQPEGFVVTDSAMGGDPHPGWVKALVVIFDDSLGRHLYSLYNIGPHVSKASIIAAAQGN